MKLTKAHLKLHDEALERLTQPVLTDEDKEFVLENFHPGATNNITKGAIHFTPLELAKTVACFSGTGRVLDACAGIGSLAYMHRGWHPDAELVCIEQNAEFVEVGKKIVPDATWICGDIFDILPTLPRFDHAISNPPYGRISTVDGVAHFAIMELLLRHCRQGAIVIIPDQDHSRADSGRHEQPSEHYRRFMTKYPEAILDPTSSDPWNQWKETGVTARVCDLSIDGMNNPYLAS